MKGSPNVAQAQADSSYTEWKGLADSQGHLVSTYNDISSWGLVYNLFADKLLGTKMVEDKVGFSHILSIKSYRGIHTDL